MRILTHNAYWFQGWPSRWGSERVAEVGEVVQALTKLYRSARPDVVCLQEVQRADLAASLSAGLGLPAWLHAPGGRRSDYGGAILGPRQARLRDLTRPDGRAEYERVHLRARVPLADGLLEVAAIHLSSNRYAGSAAAGESARLAELDGVLATPPRPNVVLGDMNSLADSLPYRRMTECGYVDAAAAGDRAAFRPRVDYIWVDADWASRVIDLAVLDDGPFVRRDGDGSPWRLSDHAPLLVELR